MITKVRKAVWARPFLLMLILVMGVTLLVTFPSLKKAEADFWTDVGEIPAAWPWKINNIAYPTIGNPAFVKKGDNLTIEFDFYGKGSSPQPATINWWDVTLFSSNDDWPTRRYCAVVSEVCEVSTAWPEGSGPWGGQQVWKVTVNVPSSTREDLYDIRIMASGPGDVKEDWQRHAVQVVDEYKNSFNFIHISDFHINDPRGPGVDLFGISIPGSPANPVEFDPPNRLGAQFPYYKYNQKAVDNVNAINPDFVVMTGDCVFGVPFFLEPPFSSNATGITDFTGWESDSWNGEFYYAYEHIMRLEVPVVLIAGNHDTYYLAKQELGVITGPQPSNTPGAPDHLLQDGAGLWPTYFGPLYFGWDYGTKGHFTNYWGYDKPKEDRASWQVPLLGYWVTPLDANAGIRATQMSFLDNDLDAADGNFNVVSLNGHHAFGGAHTAFSDAGSLTQIQDLSVAHHVDFGLSGHTHSDAVGTDEDYGNDTGDVLHINTTTTSMGTNEYPGFRHVFVDGSTVSPYYYQPTAFSHPTYKDTLIIYHPDSDSARAHFAGLHTPSIQGGFNTGQPNVTEKYFQVWNHFGGDPPVTLDNMVQDFVMMDACEASEYKITNGTLLNSWKPQTGYVILRIKLDPVPPGGYQKTTVTVPPHIDSIDPESAWSRETVAVSGSKFKAHGESSKVFFGEAEATVFSWNNTKIKVKVPDLDKGKVDVTVRNENGTSNAVEFTVKDPDDPDNPNPDPDNPDNPVVPIMPSKNVYLAEGSNNYGFETWICVQNSNDKAVKATVTYQTTEGPVPKGEVNVPAQSRLTINTGEDVPGTDFSTHIEADDIIVAERAMYWNNRIEGIESIGVSIPSMNWYLAEGSTDWGFETFILIQNPGEGDAAVTLTYMTPDGPVKQPAITVPAQSRRTVNVSEALPDEDMSTKVSSDEPVICERAMYWNLRRGGHHSIGTTAPSLNYYLAEGSTDWGFEAWVLIQNPNDKKNTVSVTYLTPEGPLPPREIVMNPNSRVSILANDDVPDEDISVKIEGTRPLIAERAMYWYGPDGGKAGHETIGVPAARKNAFFAEGSTMGGFETWILVQNPNDEKATIKLTYMTPKGEIEGPGAEIDPNSRMTFFVADSVPNEWDVSTMVESDLPIICERAMYWGDRVGGHDSIGFMSN